MIKNNAKNEEKDIYQWQQFCQGKTAALEFFYLKYYNLLYNYGLKLLNDPDHIQDFIQDIFYKICKYKHPETISNLKVYLLRSMRNSVYDYYSTIKEIQNIDDMEFSIPDDDIVFNHFFAKDDEDIQRWKSVLVAIQTLTNRQKQILYLYYIKDLSHKEIADILDIAPQTSVNTLSNTIKKLSTLLNKTLLEYLLICALA